MIRSQQEMKYYCFEDPDFTFIATPHATREQPTISIHDSAFPCNIEITVSQAEDLIRHLQAALIEIKVYEKTGKME